MKKGKQKVDTIEKLANLIEKLAAHMADGFSGVDARFDRVDEELHSIRTEVSDILRRVAHLEELGASQAGYAKEIDHILNRGARIEKHLHISR